MALTRNYDCNEFLGDDDRAIFEWMKENNPRRFAIEGRGEWGIAEGLVYENWTELDFDIDALRNQCDQYGTHRFREYFGMDFGYTNDPTAFIALLASEKEKVIYIFDEIYRTRMKNQDIYDTITYKGYKNEIITETSRLQNLCTPSMYKYYCRVE